MMDSCSSSSSCDEVEEVTSGPKDKFENDFDDPLASSDSDCDEHNVQPKSLFNFHKPFHVPSKYKQSEIAQNQSTVADVARDSYLAGAVDISVMEEVAASPPKTEMDGTKTPEDQTSLSPAVTPKPEFILSAKDTEVLNEEPQKKEQIKKKPPPVPPKPSNFQSISQTLMEEEQPVTISDRSRFDTFDKAMDIAATERTTAERQTEEREPVENVSIPVNRIPSDSINISDTMMADIGNEMSMFTMVYPEESFLVIKPEELPEEISPRSSTEKLNDDVGEDDGHTYADKKDDENGDGNDSIEKESNDNEAVEKECNDNEAMERESNDNEAMEEDSSDKEEMEKDSVDKEAVEKDSGDKETMKEDSGDNEAMGKDSGDNEAMEKDSGDKEAMKKDSDDNEAMEKDSDDNDADKKEGDVGNDNYTDGNDEDGDNNEVFKNYGVDSENADKRLSDDNNIDRKDKADDDHDATKKDEDEDDDKEDSDDEDKEDDGDNNDDENYGTADESLSEDNEVYSDSLDHHNISSSCEKRNDRSIGQKTTEPTRKSPFSESFVVIGKGFKSMSSSVSDSEIDKNMAMSRFDEDSDKMEESVPVSVRDRKSMFESIAVEHTKTVEKPKIRNRVNLSEKFKRDSQTDEILEDKQNGDVEIIAKTEKPEEKQTVSIERNESISCSVSHPSDNVSSPGSSFLILSREDSQETDTDETEDITDKETNENREETKDKKTANASTNIEYQVTEENDVPTVRLRERDVDTPPVVRPKSQKVQETLKSMIMEIDNPPAFPERQHSLKPQEFESHDGSKSGQRMVQDNSMTEAYNTIPADDYDSHVKKGSDEGNSSPPFASYGQAHQSGNFETPPGNPQYAAGVMSPEDMIRYNWWQWYTNMQQQQMPYMSHVPPYNQVFGFDPGLGASPNMAPYMPSTNIPNRPVSPMVPKTAPIPNENAEVRTEPVHSTKVNKKEKPVEVKPKIPKEQSVEHGRPVGAKVREEKSVEVKPKIPKEQSVEHGRPDGAKVREEKPVEVKPKIPKEQSVEHGRPVGAKVKERHPEKNVAKSRKLFDNENTGTKEFPKDKRTQHTAKSNANRSPRGTEKNKPVKKPTTIKPAPTTEIKRVKLDLTEDRKPITRARTPEPHRPSVKNQEEKPDTEDHFIYLENVNPKTLASTLCDYVASRMDKEVVTDKTLLNVNKGTALVIIKGKPDLDKLRESVQKKEVDGHKLRVHEVPPPTCIAVSSHDEIKSKNNLIYYFERSQIGGGEVASDTIVEAEDGSCLIFSFQDPRVVQRLCEKGRHHESDGVVLRVSPYYTCQAGCIWDTTLHLIPLPKPFTLELSDKMSNFLQRECCSDLHRNMSDNHCSLKYGNQSVEITCTMSQSTPNIRTLVKTWALDTQKIFDDYKQDKVREREYTSMPLVWDDLLKYFKSDEFTTDMLETAIEYQSRKLMFLGFPEDVDNTLDTLEKKATEIDRRKRRTKESKNFNSEHKLRLLDTINIFKDLREKYPDVEIFMVNAEVEVEGLPGDIANVFLEIFEEANNIETMEFQHDYSADCVKFVNKNQLVVNELNQMIQKKGLKTEWKLTEKELIVYVITRQTGNDVENIFTDMIIEKSVTYDRKAKKLFEEEAWTELYDEMKEKYDRYATFEELDREDKMVVFGLKGQVQDIVKNIKDHIEKNLVVEEELKCGSIEIKFIKMHKMAVINGIRQKFLQQKVELTLKDNSVVVCGTREGIERAKPEVEKIIHSVIQKQHKIEKVMVWDVFTSEKEKGTLEAIEKNTGCIIQLPDGFETYQVSSDSADSFRSSRGAAVGSDSDEDFYDSIDTSPAPAKGFKANNGVRVSLVKGEIGDQSGHVLVVTTSPNLNLKSGAACGSVLKAGGDELQRQCRKKYPKEIQFGEVAAVKACGILECQDVYLTALPSWRDNDSAKDILQKFMKDCLQKASKDQKGSILFSALGTGQLKYPTDMVAMMMYKAVIDFDANNPTTTLKDVYFVLYQKDHPTIKVFEEEERLLLEGSGTRPTHDVQAGPVKIEMAVSNLAEQKVDGILCTTSTKMELSKSGACAALVRAGGTTLQDECQNKYKNSLAPGKVAAIGGGKLLCKTVYLTVLPSYSPGEAEKLLKDVIQTCLGLAQAQKYSSLAIPALGTGFLKYPKQEACRWMYEAVSEWATKNPTTCVKTVKFILYAKDYELIQAFKGYIVKYQGKVSRSNRTLHQASRKGRILEEDTKNEAKHGGPDLENSQKKFNADSNGCQIRQVYLKVYKSDILDEDSDAIVNSVGKSLQFQGAVAQALLKKCRNLKDESQKQRNIDKIDKKGILVTKCSGLPTKNIIHVQFEESLGGWRKIMKKCLQKANDKKWTSLSFPVLGSGTGYLTFDPAHIAEELFEAINEFTSGNHNIHVKDVRLVVFKGTPTMFDPIMDALHKKAQNAASSQTGTFDRLKKFGAGVKDYVLRQKKGTLSPAETVKYRETKSSLQLKIYSDSKDNITNCIKELDAKLEKAYITLKIENYNEIVRTLTADEEKQLNDTPMLVNMKTDKAAGIIFISGPFRQADDARAELYSTIRNIEKRRNIVKESDTLYQLVRWHHEDVTATGINLIAYDKTSNYNIERAYKDNRKNVELVDNTGGVTVYVIDFEKLIDYPKGDESDSVKVIRKDLIKATSDALPDTWTTMKDNENIKLVNLAATDADYKTTEQRFLTEVQTGSYSGRYTFDKNKVKVSKIERIQNKALYQQYAAKKKQIEGQKTNLPANMPIERLVWHGTTPDCVNSIQMHGFNRSYCGKNGIWFGAGVYFAGNASYSARSWLSGANAPANAGPTKGYMFLVKALTGQFCKGNDQMRYLPAVDPAKPLVLYDSAVDNIANPMEFVIFHDTQAYPEYILTFTTQ